MPLTRHAAPDPPVPAAAAAAEATAPASPIRLAGTAGSTGNTAPAADHAAKNCRPHPASGEALEQLIRDGVAAGLSRRRLYRLAIDSQLRASYHPHLSPADHRAAATLLLTDRYVRRLFDQLYAAA